MKNSKNVRYSISITILGLSIVFWILLLFDPINLMNGNHCHVSVEGLSQVSSETLLAKNPFSNLMIGWILMVFAMMLPKLISPIQHIYERSFKRKRFSSAVLFILGYAIVWIVVGFIMNLAILSFNVLIPGSYMPAIVIGAIALIWQFSPIKQRFLNLGHDHRSIAAFGRAASIDAFQFGVMHGVYCFGAGWALMWFPMLLPVGHNIAMMIVTVIMISEHMEHPQIPAWRFNFRLKLLRIINAQTTMKIKQVLSLN